MNKQYKILSTFTGCGGLDIGFHGDFNFLGQNFKKLPFETIFAIDNNFHACQSLEHDKKYFKNAKIICDDITVYPLEKIKISPDVLIGGFPCVTFSTVGKQAGITDDINGKLYERFAKYVEYFKPKVFLAENVKGILSANKGEAIKIIKERFEIDGYNLKVFLVNFADFGVPQQRERVIFIGIRDDIKTEFIPPEYTNFNNHINCLQAFNGVKKIKLNNEYLNISEKTSKMISWIPEGQNFKALNENPSCPYSIKGLMSNIYRRLDREKPAYTVIASGGGGTWTYHYEENRPLTNRERARLQSFPDDYLFLGSTTEVRRQIGNAVPPVGIYSFAERIANVLEGIIPIHNLSHCIKEIQINKPFSDIKKTS